MALTRAIKRCEWVKSNLIEINYHDHEWGVPIHDDRLLFEFLILEGAQAGLSWSTILNKRSGYRKAFDNFDVKKVAKYKDAKIQKLLVNQEIVRNKLKINSTVSNAVSFIEIQKEHGSFNDYIWAFVNNKPIQNKWKSLSEIPSSTDLSDIITKDLKKNGFKFVGTTIVYAFIQAIGMVNDHTTSCFRHKEVKKIKS
jgi:DNA-3-methyladenine glycosylase I